ncbi:MAG: inovirus-type Gp2 protein [Alphaproteobacteria bacterium]|nr:inovirus-type Gp2 protein [Alphaproteobacteria bacterium]
MNRSTTFEPEFNGKPILADKEKQLDCDTKILNKIEEVFEHMTQKHSKVLFLRYDIRLPSGKSHSPDNKVFTRFQANFMKNLDRNGLDPHYVAVREQSKEKHQHYHVTLLLDGHKTQSPYGHIQKADELLASTLGAEHKGLIDGCWKNRNGEPQKNGIMLRKDDPEYAVKYDQCFQWASYLAKTNQKANCPKHKHEIFSSIIKEKGDTK